MHHTQQADILIVAAGIKHMINKDYVKKGVVIVDVGIHRNDDGTLSGDVHPSAYELASAYSPVPKGVGPMTIAGLLLNTYQAFQERG
jgi:methylenetetrahydrofolate dehydrogenase (NADP+)/methenyltetrahydrofolate cyclohydrolase